jgi:hypothetical protein
LDRDFVGAWPFVDRQRCECRWPRCPCRRRRRLQKLRAMAAMANLLRGAGFDVIEGIDLSRDEMVQRSLEFGDKAKGADIAVFYHSGQGISVDGSEFLLATDADIKSRIDVKPGNAFDADLAIDHERSKNQARVPGRFAQQPP